MHKFNPVKASLVALTGLLISSTIPVDKASAAACPSASGYANEGAFGTALGSCSGTPAVYGITVLKMGLCSEDPAPSTGGVPDFSKCSLTFDGSEAVSFAAGGTVDLSKGTRPENGKYPYAIILFENNFKIQAQYGPFNGGAGNTWYSTSTYQTSNTTGPAATFTAPLNTFGLDTTPNTCVSTSSVSGSSGTMTGYILDGSMSLVADDASATTCTGASYLLGKVQLNTPVTITEDTTECRANFTVTDNGTTVYYQANGTGTCTNAAGCIAFDSGPFDVQFTILE